MKAGTRTVAQRACVIGLAAVGCLVVARGCRAEELAPAWSGAVENAFRAAESDLPKQRRDELGRLEAVVLETLKDSEATALVAERLERFRKDLPKLAKQTVLEMTEFTDLVSPESRIAYLGALTRWRVERFLDGPVPDEDDIQRLLGQIDELYEMASEQLAQETPGIARAMAGVWERRRPFIRQRVSCGFIMSRKAPWSAEERKEVELRVKSACESAQGQAADSQVPEAHGDMVLKAAAARVVAAIQSAALRPPEGIELPQYFQEALDRVGEEQRAAMRAKRSRWKKEQEEAMVRGMLDFSAWGGHDTSLVFEALIEALGCVWGNPVAAPVGEKNDAE